MAGRRLLRWNRCRESGMSPRHCFNLYVKGFSQVRSTISSFETSESPALGLTWSHCVNTRIRLRRYHKHNLLAHPPLDHDENSVNGESVNPGLNDSSRSFKRNITLEFSPCRPSRSCYFVIEPIGVRGMR